MSETSIHCSCIFAVVQRCIFQPPYGRPSFPGNPRRRNLLYGHTFPTTFHSLPELLFQLHNIFYNNLSVPFTIPKWPNGGFLTYITLFITILELSRLLTFEFMKHSPWETLLICSDVYACLQCIHFVLIFLSLHPN